MGILLWNPNIAHYKNCDVMTICYRCNLHLSVSASLRSEYQPSHHQWQLLSWTLLLHGCFGTDKSANPLPSIISYPTPKVSEGQDIVRITVIYILFKLFQLFPIMITMHRTSVLCWKGWASLLRQSDMEERARMFKLTCQRGQTLHSLCVTLPSLHSLVWFWVNVAEDMT